MDEWKELGQRILEANPEKYNRLVVLLRQIVTAEEKLASPDIRMMIDLLRTRLLAT